MSHAYSPRRREVYRDAEKARRERQEARRRARMVKRVETGAVSVIQGR